MILRKKLLDFIGRWVIDQNCGKGDRIKKNTQRKQEDSNYQ